MVVDSARDFKSAGGVGSAGGIGSNLGVRLARLFRLRELESSGGVRLGRQLESTRGEVQVESRE